MQSVLAAILSSEFIQAERATVSVAEHSWTSLELQKLVADIPDFTKLAIQKFGTERAEILVWNLGEAIRRVLKTTRPLRRDPALFGMLQTVACARSVGRGREPFVMLLGQYGGSSHVPTLLELLDEPELAGHALYALRLIGAPDGVFRARMLLESPKTWVRAEARKYLEKIGQSPKRT